MVRLAVLRRDLDSRMLRVDPLISVESFPIPGLSLSAVPSGAGLTGSTLKTNSQSVRSLLLSASGKSVTLYLWDGNQTYTQCSTYVTLENLQEVVGSYELGNAFFAFELGTKYTSFAPLSLFIAGDPTVPILSASTGPTDANALLTALNFNPHTNSRYTEISGTEVIMLEGYGIPAFKNGSLGKVLCGFAGQGVELYVPASRLEEARELLNHPDTEDGGEL